MAKKLIKRWLPDWRHHPHLNRVFGGIMKRDHLWHINRYSVSVAVAVGLFCAFIPVPVQMLLAAAGAIMLRANLPTAVVIVWITNPFTVTPIFYFCYKIGLILLSLFGRVFYYEPTFEWLGTAFSTAWQPLLLGCLAVGSIAASFGYAVVRLLWRYYVATHWRYRRTSSESRSVFGKPKQSDSQRRQPFSR